MKFHLSTLLTISVAVIGLSSTAASAQDIKIAVVDMQKALTDYYKTDLEVEKINSLGEEKTKNIDERKAALQQMGSQMADLEKTYRDTALGDGPRKEALEKLQALDKEARVKSKEINDASRKANEEITKARVAMEELLLGEIKDTVNTIVTAQGIDLVFDKSYLPKAGTKAIIFTSENVSDLTEEVIAALNAGAPATTSN